MSKRIIKNKNKADCKKIAYIFKSDEEYRRFYDQCIKENINWASHRYNGTKSYRKYGCDDINDWFVVVHEDGTMYQGNCLNLYTTSYDFIRYNPKESNKIW